MGFFKPNNINVPGVDLTGLQSGINELKAGHSNITNNQSALISNSNAIMTQGTNAYNMAKNAYNQSSANYQAINQIKLNVDKIVNNKGVLLIKAPFLVNVPDMSQVNFPYTAPNGAMAVIAKVQINGSGTITYTIKSNGETKIFDTYDTGYIVLCDEDYLAQLSLSILQGSNGSQAVALITTPRLPGTTIDLALIGCTLLNFKVCAICE